MKTLWALWCNTLPTLVILKNSQWQPTCCEKADIYCNPHYTYVYYDFMIILWTIHLIHTIKPLYSHNRPIFSSCIIPLWYVYSIVIFSPPKLWRTYIDNSHPNRFQIIQATLDTRRHHPTVNTSVQHTPINNIHLSPVRSTYLSLNTPSVNPFRFTTHPQISTP